MTNYHKFNDFETPSGSQRSVGWSLGTVFRFSWLKSRCQLSCVLIWKSVSWFKVTGLCQNSLSCGHRTKFPSSLLNVGTWTPSFLKPGTGTLPPTEFLSYIKSYLDACPFKGLPDSMRFIKENLQGLYKHVHHRARSGVLDS